MKNLTTIAITAALTIGFTVSAYSVSYGDDINVIDRYEAAVQSRSVKNGQINIEIYKYEDENATCYVSIERQYGRHHLSCVGSSTPSVVK